MFVKDMIIGPMERKKVIVVPLGYHCNQLKVESLRQNEEDEDVWVFEYISDCLGPNEFVSILNESPYPVKYRISGHFVQVN